MTSIIFKEKNSGVTVKIDDIHKLTKEELISLLDAIKEKLDEDLENKPIEIPVEISISG